MSLPVSTTKRQWCWPIIAGCWLQPLMTLLKKRFWRIAARINSDRHKMVLPLLMDGRPRINAQLLPGVIKTSPCVSLWLLSRCMWCLIHACYRAFSPKHCYCSILDLHIWHKSEGARFVGWCAALPLLEGCGHWCHRPSHCSWWHGWCPHTDSALLSDTLWLTLVVLSLESRSFH